MQKHIPITLSLILALIQAVHAQNNLIGFERINGRDGLSQFSVYSILQDSKGFLWFGSLDGLSRFDGYDFKVYNRNSSDSTTLSDDWILALHEDAEGIIWIGTATGGLNKFDRTTGEFKNFPLVDFVVATQDENIPIVEAPIPYSLLVNKSITKIYEDNRGFLWIGTWGGRILKFNKQTETFLTYDHPDADDATLYKSPIMEIYEDSNGAFWIGTFGGGLFRHGFLKNADKYAVADNGAFQHYKHDPWNSNSLTNNRVVSMLEVQPGILLIATFGGGLSVLNSMTGQFVNYEHDFEKTNSISGNNLVALFQDNEGDIWIGTFGNGLNRVVAPKKNEATPGNGSHPDFNNLEFIHYVHEEANPKSLSDNGVLTIYEDRGGVLWVGTHRGGVNKFVRKRNQFINYTSNPYDSQSLNDHTVMAFAEDRSGNLWIGTYHGGLNKFDHKRKKFTYYKHDPANPNSLSHNNIRSLHIDKNNILWIGTRNGGLNRFDIEKEIFTHYRYDAKNPNSILNNQIIPICEDRDGYLWIGIFGSGLSKFDKKNEFFTNYIPDSKNPNSLSGKRVYAIIEDQTGKLWIGTFGDGLNVFDKTTGIFQHYFHNRSDSTSLGNNRILSLYEDRNGTIWVGTFGGGLCQFDRETETFKSFTKKDGLPSDAIFGILDDAQGNIWVSTGNGLSRLSPETGIINNYDIYDGLQSNVFNTGAAFKCTSGEMFFGGVNGFNCFYPNQIKRSEYNAPIVISDFKKFNRSIQGEKKEIILSPDENFFTIEFAALDYSSPGRNHYAYQLEGLSKEWIQCGTQQSVSYANLSPGSYTFHIRGTNSDGVWNNDEASLKIIIKPPFWQTMWFYSIVALVALIGAAFTLQYQFRAKIKRTFEIEKIRLRENEKVRKQVADDFHDELGHKLTHISLFTEIVKRNLRKTQPEDYAYLEKIGETAKNLSLGITNFIWALDPEQDSLYDVAFYLKDFGDELFSKTGIHFWAEEITSNMKNVKIPMHWRRHITLLFKEGMHNVLKHSECENVNFEVKSNRDYFDILLSDDGKGFDCELYTPGKGLRNMRNRAQKLQCKLKVLSSFGEGSTVHFKGHIL